MVISSELLLAFTMYKLIRLIIQADHFHPEGLKLGGYVIRGKDPLTCESKCSTLDNELLFLSFI